MPFVFASHRGLLSRKPVVAASFTPWTIGFDFRNTAGYVTDPTDCVYWSKELSGTVKSSALGQSVTAGWDSALNLNANDRNNTTADPRLAGEVQDQQNGTNSNFIITLPAAGVYDVVAAFGDASSSEASLTATLFDNTTQLFQYFRQSVTSGNMIDATGAQYTYLLWPANNTANRLTFATTTCKLKMGNGSDSGVSPVAHFHLNRIS